MKSFPNGAALAAEIGIPPEKLEETFRKYNEAAASNKDPFGKKFFDAVPFRMDDQFHVSIVTPVLHFCMGGLEITPDGEVLDKNGRPIPGLFAAGEVCGGVHGANRLGGSSLLGCVVFGRVAGDTASRYLFNSLITQQRQGFSLFFLSFLFLFFFSLIFLFFPTFFFVFLFLPPFVM
jgi:succinate dehydrogenase/fumarate reductase flavoprotein subunit